MPLYEYKCSECNTKFEVLHKSSINQDDINCPNCNSAANKKLFSSFSSLMSSPKDSFFESCSTGNCGIEKNSCASGMCGLN